MEGVYTQNHCSHRYHMGRYGATAAKIAPKMRECSNKRLIPSLPLYHLLSPTSSAPQSTKALNTQQIGSMNSHERIAVPQAHYAPMP